MIQQINNQSVRFKEKGASDIDYLIQVSQVQLAAFNL